jgi:hypothetical protein
MDGENFIQTKQCARCKEFKSYEKFYKNKNGIFGLSSNCRLCQSSIQKEPIILGRRKHLRYGVSQDQLDIMLKNQNGKCPICEIEIEFTFSLHHSLKFKNSACIDHEEGTLNIRGLLCPKCNSGLGMFNHNIAFFKKAILYLKSPISLIGDKKNISKIRGKGKNNTSGYLGIFSTKNKKWVAQIRIKNKNIYLGTYSYPEQAALAYDNFVRTNFPQGSTLNNIPPDWSPLGPITY